MRETTITHRSRVSIARRVEKRSGGSAYFGPAAWRIAARLILQAPPLEGVNDVGRQGVLAVPEMLPNERASIVELGFVVGERGLICIVMPVFQTTDQTRHVGDLVAECLGDLPYRLPLAVPARPVH